ncbi:MAG: hypothetical protein PF508_03250 [Spirochaeta sp.]|jgi:hypothetical protein|nr:hypothetical protein [Spirochaeta sp.]
MTCNDVRAALAAHDNGDPCSQEIRHHLSRCAQCRRLEAKLRTVEMAGMPQSDAAAPVVDLVMNRISEAVPRQYSPDNELSGYPARGPHRSLWLAGAVLLPLALFTLRHNPSFQFLVTTSFGPAVDFWVNIAIGGFLVGYLFVLIAAQPFRPKDSQRFVDRVGAVDD